MLIKNYAKFPCFKLLPSDCQKWLIEFGNSAEPIHCDLCKLFCIISKKWATGKLAVRKSPTEIIKIALCNLPRAQTGNTTLNKNEYRIWAYEKEFIIQTYLECEDKYGCAEFSYEDIPEDDYKWRDMADWKMQNCKLQTYVYVKIGQSNTIKRVPYFFYIHSQTEPLDT